MAKPIQKLTAQNTLHITLAHAKFYQNRKRFRDPKVRALFVDLVCSVVAISEPLPELSTIFQTAARECYANFKDFVFYESTVRRKFKRAETIREPILPGGLAVMTASFLPFISGEGAWLLFSAGGAITFTYLASRNEEVIQLTRYNQAKDWFFKNTPERIFQPGFRGALEDVLTEAFQPVVPRGYSGTNRRLLPKYKQGADFMDSLMFAINDSSVRSHSSSDIEEEIFRDHARAVNKLCPERSFREVWRAFRAKTPAV